MPCELDACLQGRRECADRAICFPDTGDDEPLATPEDAMGWLTPAQGAIALLAIVCAVMAALHFFRT